MCFSTSLSFVGEFFFPLSRISICYENEEVIMQLFPLVENNNSVEM